MKRTICAAFLVALLGAPDLLAGTWHKTVAAAQKAASAQNQLIFVDMWADWCGWCHRFEAEVVPSEAFQQATAKMVLLRLNTEDGGEGTQFAQKYKATRLPMFLILNPDLTIAGVINGYAPAAQFASMVTQTVIRYRTFESTVKREAEMAGDYPRRLLLAKEFRERQNYAGAESRLRKLTAEKGVPAAFRDEAYLELASIYLDQNRLTDVMTVVNDFRKIQKQGESFERATLLVFDVYVRQGNLAKAADELRTFKARFPESQFIPSVDRILPSIERQLKQ
ncbi:MAG TPA: thioredoxin family protein [Thermoanaerobaculia bacterium]|nr:thioredoxin family protein [Thermoanaerobaculia bacterium]